jgi:hypothetical protein
LTSDKKEGRLVLEEKNKLEAKKGKIMGTQDFALTAHFAVMYMEAFSGSEKGNQMIMKMSLAHLSFMIEHGKEGSFKEFIKGVTEGQTPQSWDLVPKLYKERKEKAEAEARAKQKAEAEAPALIAAYNAKLEEWAREIEAAYYGSEVTAISEGCRVLKRNGVSISNRKAAVRLWQSRRAA